MERYSPEKQAIFIFLWNVRELIVGSKYQSWSLKSIFHFVFKLTFVFTFTWPKAAKEKLTLSSGKLRAESGRFLFCHATRKENSDVLKKKWSFVVLRKLKQIFGHLWIQVRDNQRHHLFTPFKRDFKVFKVMTCETFYEYVLQSNKENVIMTNISTINMSNKWLYFFRGLWTVRIQPGCKFELTPFLRTQAHRPLLCIACPAGC